MHLMVLRFAPADSSISLTVISARILASSGIWRESAGRDERRACSSLTFAARLFFCLTIVLWKNTSQYSQFYFPLRMVCCMRRNAR